MEFDEFWASKVIDRVSFDAINVTCYDILKSKIQDESVLLPEYFFLNLGFKRIPSCFYLDYKSVFHNRLCIKQPVIVMGTISYEYQTMLEL